MSVDILKLRTLAEAAQRNPRNYVVLNDYGMAVTPTTVLELIAEIERRRQVEAEGCKPESSNLHPSITCAGVETSRSLDNVEGWKPDLIHPDCEIPADAAGYPDDPPGTPYDEPASKLHAAFSASEVTNALTAAALDLLKERDRQINSKGHSSEQDDQYMNGELADAGSVYAFWANTFNLGLIAHTPPSCWPWPPEHWKPTSQRHMLIKAGALILAELDRLDRLQASEVRNG